MESRTSGLVNSFGKSTAGENIASQHQVNEKNIDDKIRKAVENAVLTVKNWVYGAILTAMENVVIPRVEITNKSIAESSGQCPSSVVQNLDQGDFAGSTEKSPLMYASSTVDLNIDQGRNDETRNVENFEDGDLPALRPNYDRIAHVHHSPANFYMIM